MTLSIQEIQRRADASQRWANEARANAVRRRRRHRWFAAGALSVVLVCAGATWVVILLHG